MRKVLNKIAFFVVCISSIIKNILNPLFILQQGFTIISGGYLTEVSVSRKFLLKPGTIVKHDIL